MDYIVATTVMVFCFHLAGGAHWYNYLPKPSKPFLHQPVLPSRPFVSVWNVNTENCMKSFNISIDLEAFDIINNPDQAFYGDHMVIFYSNSLGLYPHFDTEGHTLNGGIPQLGNLTAHLKKARSDIEKYIPDEDFSGLAVIDWENWKPLWNFNDFGEGSVYCNASIKLVEKAHPDWTKEQVIAQAKKEFETAAKSFLLNTVQLGVSMRPHANWGYYLLPDCYNYDKTGHNLTCRSNIMKENDQLEWLFSASTALYPSTYLGLWFKNTTYSAEYTANRILEARRVDKNRPGNMSIPIYVYNNLVYRKTKEYLLYKDVVESSGVAAILGASGVVIWGQALAKSAESCTKLKSYVETTLGPYLKLASDSASECSIDFCNGNGRCVVTWPLSISPQQPLPYLLQKFLKKTLPMKVKYNLFCQCYAGYSGKSCQFY